MKHKTHKNGSKTPWELAWEARKYPARLDEAKDMSKEDVVFCLLMWFGLSQIDAYKIAYQPRASRNSIAAMAWVYTYRCRLDLWTDDKLKFK